MSLTHKSWKHPQLCTYRAFRQTFYLAFDARSTVFVYRNLGQFIYQGPYRVIRNGWIEFPGIGIPIPEIPQRIHSADLHKFPISKAPGHVRKRAETILADRVMDHIDNAKKHIP